MLRKAKKEKFNVPGTIVECQSGTFLAFYEHRTDIIANGESAIEAKKNLKKMFEVVREHEKMEEKQVTDEIPPPVKYTKFRQELAWL